MNFQEITSKLADLERKISGILSMQERTGLRIEKLERPEFIDVITVSSASPAIAGKYRAGAENIVLLLDASNGDIVVPMPSAKDSKNIILTAKKIDATANTITFQAKPGEFIFDSAAATTLVISTTVPVNMVSNRVDSWLVAG